MSETSREMKPIDIGKAYDQLAERWTSDEFPRTNGIDAHQRAMSFVGSKGHALDIGCGSNDRFIDLLKAHGFRVEAIDVSSRMIELAKRKHPDIENSLRRHPGVELSKEI